MDNAIGAFDAELDRSVLSPILPAVCIEGVLSVAVTDHVDGSMAPIGHTFARIVVGPVPVAWTRILSGTLLA